MGRRAGAAARQLNEPMTARAASAVGTARRRYHWHRLVVPLADCTEVQRFHTMRPRPEHQRHDPTWRGLRTMATTDQRAGFRLPWSSDQRPQANETATEAADGSDSATRDHTATAGLESAARP